MKITTIAHGVFCCALFFFLLSALLAGAQEGDSGDTGTSDPWEISVLLAVTTADYPVTPGDRYHLTYYHANRIVTQDLLVEYDGTLNLGIFGIVQTSGLTLPAMRRAIETIITQIYRDSFPRIIIRGLGQFDVMVRGEVTSAGLVRIDGLTRLSTVYRSRSTQYASERRITIIRADDSRQEADLFRARRAGDLTQDPYLRPGDVITFSRADRAISLSGRVYRDGEYQLLPGETMADLLQQYGEGTLEDADLSEVRIDRVSTDPGEATRTLYVNLRETRPGEVTLHHRDQVIIPSRDRFRPVVYFELIGADGDERIREEVRFTSGEKISEVVRRSREIIPAGADLSAAYLVRAGLDEVTSVDLNRFRWDPNPPGDMELVSGDRIVVPSTARFVVVSGAVRSPGTVAFIPGRTYEYYLAIRGGINPSERWGRRPIVRGADNRLRNLDEPLQPGDRIHVRTNSPFFYMLPVASLISTVLSIFLAVR